MSSGLVEGHGTPVNHPLVGLVDALSAALDAGASGNAWTLTPNELRAVLPALTRVKARVAEVELRVLVEADRGSVGDEEAFTSTALWWAHATGQAKPAAIGALKLGQALDVHETTRAAMTCGGVNAEQARVIVDAVEALPADLVPAEIVASAETHLVELASDHDPKALRILGRKILDVLAPEVAEEHERRVLEAEEQHAAATSSFAMRPDGQGSMLGRFKIPVLAGEILAKHLAAIAAPRHRGGQGPSRNPASRPLRLGQAFVEYLETRAASGAPKAGGIAATIVVTMTKDDFTGATDKAALLDTGEHISASEARRLACEAGIIPAVLGTRSQALDLGRKTRFHTEPQRTALMLRDQGCAEAHCDWPPGMCHAHHPTPWSKGGTTSVSNGVLLCPRHHTLAHNARYQLKGTSNGKVIFSRTT